MSEENVKTDAASAGDAAPKKTRRGISNQTQAVSQLKFHEKDAEPNGLFKGHLEEVTVDWSNSETNKSFPNTPVPRLTFHFCSNHLNSSEKRHIYQSLFPVESNVNTIPGGSEEWKVNNVLRWIKHILDIFYLKGRPLTEVEESALSLSFEDFDENGNFIVVEVDEVLAGYRKIFENAAAMLNGTFSANGEEVTGKPCYKTADGKFIICWLKLLRHRKNKGEWINVGANGDLAFDSFIGNGVVELFKTGCNPTILNIDLSKESITPKETKKAPTVGMPGVGAPFAGNVIPGMPSDGFGGGDNNAYQEAGAQMPF